MIHIFTCSFFISLKFCGTRLTAQHTTDNISVFYEEKKCESVFVSAKPMHQADKKKKVTDFNYQHFTFCEMRKERNSL